jgi:hypothetical protein
MSCRMATPIGNSSKETKESGERLRNASPIVFNAMQVDNAEGESNKKERHRRHL